MTLLAIDLGLRAGFAEYSEEGRLVRYGSTNFGTIARLKKGAFREVGQLESLSALVVEGDVNLARPWIKAAEKRGAKTLLVQAHQWRKDLLLDREQRSGVEAKKVADARAREIIDASSAKKPTSLRHDAAEAILIGWWGCIQLGWVSPDQRASG